MFIGPAMMWVAHTSPTTPGMPRQADANVGPWWEEGREGTGWRIASSLLLIHFTARWEVRERCPTACPHGEHLLKKSHFLTFPCRQQQRGCKGSEKGRWSKFSPLGHH